MRSRPGDDDQRFAKELREALNAMQGALEILRVSGDAPTRHRMHEVLDRQIATLVDLIALHTVAQPAEPGAQGLAEPSPGTGRRVLVVDDNADSAEVLAALLEQLGHQAHVAFDGKGALEQVRKLRPEVIFLDLALPDMSGFDVARRIRADASFAGTRIIGLTGFGSEEHRRRSTDAGIDDFVVKPVDVDALVALMQPK